MPPEVAAVAVLGVLLPGLLQQPPVGFVQLLVRFPLPVVMVLVNDIWASRNGTHCCRNLLLLIV